MRLSQAEETILQMFRSDASTMFTFDYIIHDGTTPVCSNDPGVLRDMMAETKSRAWSVWKYRREDIFDLAGVPCPVAADNVADVLPKC